MKFRSLIYVIAGTLLLLAQAAPATAGPQLTFGPDDEGVLQIDYKSQFRMLVSDSGSGPDGGDTTMNMNFRRNRLAFMGAYGDIMSIYVQTEYGQNMNIGPLGVADSDQGSNFQMLDAVIRFNLDERFKLNVGKFKYNLSRENLEGCEVPLNLDRSDFIRTSLVATRDQGIAAWGNLADGLFQYRLDVMEGRNAVSGAVAPASNFRYAARIHFSLLDPETAYGYKGTYRGQKKVLTIGGAVETEPDVVYADVAALTGEKDYNAYTFDVFFEYPVGEGGAFTLSGAYENIDFDDAYKGLHPDPGTVGLSGQKNGWYIKSGFMPSGSKVQLFGRYESWNFAMLKNVCDQQIDWYGFGANYFLPDDKLKLTVQYSSTTFDKKGVFDGMQGTGLVTDDFGTFVTQLQLVF